MTAERTGTPAPLPITLEGNGLVPQDARLTFSLKAMGETRFSAGDKVDVATEAGEPATRIDLRLQDRTVAIATLSPGTALGPSAYGPLRFRLVLDGSVGDWQPLATLVRLPTLTGLDCGGTAATCRLAGSNLFLLRAVVAREAQTAVPDGFTGTALDVPRPVQGRLKLILRDAPEASAYAATNR